MKVELHVKVNDEWLCAIEKDEVREHHLGHAIDQLAMKIVKGIEDMHYKNDYSNARPATFDKEGAIVTEDQGNNAGCRCDYCGKVRECKACESTDESHCKDCHMEFHS